MNDNTSVMRNHCISYIRVISMFMILGTHAKLIFTLPSFFDIIFRFGHLFVASFFVISGYLNIQSLEHKSIVKFYKKKLINILLLYEMVVILDIIYLVFIKSSIDFSFNLLLRYLFCVQMFFPSAEFYIYNDMYALWTMSPLLLFYLFTPIFYKIVRIVKSCNWFFAIVIFLWLGGLAGRKIIYIMLSHVNWVSEPMTFAVWFPLNIIYLYATGIFCYLAIKNNKQIIWGIVFLVLSIFMIIFNGMDFCSIALIIATIIMVTSNLDIKIPTIIKQLEKISYPVYLIHFLIFNVIADFIGTSSCNALMGIGISIIIATGLWHVNSNIKRRFINKD